MRAFEYTRATTLDQAVALLEANGHSAARPLAGGTDLVPLMKADVAAPEHLVDIKRLPELASGIVDGPHGLTIGALTLLSTIETDAAIGERYRALPEAAGLAATPQLRNMATLGGNLLQRPRCWYYRGSLFNCWLKGGQECYARDGESQLHGIFDASPCVAVHPSDPAAALLALDAEVQLNTRVLPIGEFFSLPTDAHRQESNLRADELIVSIRMPRQPSGTRSTYRKAMNRKVWAFALVGVAASISMDGGRIVDARLVLSGVAPVPWRAEAAERRLVGAVPSEALWSEIADVALADARPLAHNAYKVSLGKGMIRQALAAVTG